jgi:hypothetical protein
MELERWWSGKSKNQSSTDIYKRYVALFNAYTATAIVQSEQLTSLYKTTLLVTI